MSKVIQCTTSLQTFEDHESYINEVAVFPDRQRMVTGSWDKTLRLWDLKTGVVLKKMEGHRSEVQALTVSRDGQIIASGDWEGEIIAWHEEIAVQTIKAHSNRVSSVDFSPDGTVLATGSYDRTTKLWCTKTWELQENPIECNSWVRCVRYSPSGTLLAIATDRDIQIYYLVGARECVATFKGHKSWNLSLTWTPDGTRLVSGGVDSSIREWDTSTWKEVGHPWEGHTGSINTIAIHPSGTLVASASEDKYVRLWRLSDRKTIATFQHSFSTKCVIFSVDGRHIFSGGFDKMISEWPVPRGTHPKASSHPRFS
jgi:WD40 repeat protein